MRLGERGKGGREAIFFTLLLTFKQGPPNVVLLEGNGKKGGKKAKGR
jgi:hypothetical protein